jgi:hypothetical protein
MNAVILTLEAEGFAVSVEHGKHGTGAQIFGHLVKFAVVEKIRETGRREIKEYSWTRTVIDYGPKGQLEFRYGDYIYGRKYRDGKKQRLESSLRSCVDSDGPHVVRKYPVARSALFKTSQDAWLANLLSAN